MTTGGSIPPTCTNIRNELEGKHRSFKPTKQWFDSTITDQGIQPIGRKRFAKPSRRKPKEFESLVFRLRGESGMYEESVLKTPARKGLELNSLSPRHFKRSKHDK